MSCGPPLANEHNLVPRISLYPSLRMATSYFLNSVALRWKVVWMGHACSSVSMGVRSGHPGTKYTAGHRTVINPFYDTEWHPADRCNILTNCSHSGTILYHIYPVVKKCLWEVDQSKLNLIRNSVVQGFQWGTPLSTVKWRTLSNVSTSNFIHIAIGKACLIY